MFQTKPVSNTHSLFGYSGLIPFLILPLAIAVLGHPYESWLISYAALIFSFLGGVLWMASLQSESPKHIVWVSIITMLWAWCWIIFPSFINLQVAGLSFFSLWIYEKYSLTEAYSPSFWKLRTHLTVIASSALIISGFLWWCRRVIQPGIYV